MQVLCVIPARLGSSRLPNKPLRLLTGQPLIRRIAERVRGFDLDGPVVVATDDQRVADAVQGVGVHAVLTASEHRSGTERVAEVACRAEFAGFDIILNVQGDEPFVPEGAVRGALGRVLGGDAIGTAGATLVPGHASDTNRVKVQVDRNGHAVAFFRRLNAPHAADACGGRRVAGIHLLHHIGVYAYRREALLSWVSTGAVAGETSERLEQLRPLALGMTIGVALVNEHVLPGIDTEEDLALANGQIALAFPSPRRGEGTGVRV